MMIEWTDNYGNLHKGKILETVEGYEVIDCEICGYAHVIPVPDKEFLENYYRTKFIKNRPNNFYETMQEDFAWHKIFYEEKYDIFEKHLSEDKRSIVDVGSGLGFFINVGKSRGWNVSGIEASEESVEYSRKFDVKVFNEYLSAENYKKFGKYDVVHLHEVIEHLANPREFIKISREMLNPDGLVCIVSPNEFNPLQEAFIETSKLNRWWVAPPEHLNYFNFSSITRLLESEGFEVLDKTTSFPLELFLLMGNNYIGDRDIGRKMHLQRQRLEMSLYSSGNEELRRDIYKKFADLSIGREFLIVAKKIN